MSKYLYDHNIKLLMRALKQIRKVHPEDRQDRVRLEAHASFPGDVPVIESFDISDSYGEIVGTIGWVEPYGFNSEGFWAITDIRFEETGRDE
jgi:hypothetical protein